MPRVIWLVWLQGWDSPPYVAQASRASWSGRNPGWKVQLLDRASLDLFIPRNQLNRILATKAPYESLSDLVRLELLHRYGGIWADATTVCAKPLDDWIDHYARQGFFAFDRPGPNRLISTWFLAAHKGSYIVEQWREAAATYWSDRIERDEYFWVHNLFGLLYERDAHFKSIWDSVPKISAAHHFHFGPNAPALFDPPRPDHIEGLVSPSAPVIKLTHKLSKPIGDHSLMTAICSSAMQAGQARRAPLPERRVLVTWYGSFGHGTIGDLHSMESVVTHLHGVGHRVSHATDLSVEIPGCHRVNWRTVDAASFDCVVFVCGPIIKTHRESSRLFARFSSSRMAGVGVSLFPRNDSNYCNPFQTVFARQGTEKDYGDVAIVAPKPLRKERLCRNPRIGVVLRGEQTEYGAELCLWAKTEILVLRAAWAAIRTVHGEMTAIENHLVHSGEPPDKIEQYYRECDLVLTSRFHGAIESLRSGVPFIAIDQIKGGAKVVELLSKLGWRHVYKVEDVGFDVVAEAARTLLEDPMPAELFNARNAAVSLANKTLESLTEWVAASCNP